MKRTDPHTGEEFMPQRSNQRFASRENQIAHNNWKAKEERDKVKKIDNARHKSRKILKTLLGDHQSKSFSKSYLQGAGVDLRCLTHLAEEDGQLYRCLYEYMIIEDPEDHSIIKIKVDEDI